MPNKQLDFANWNEWSVIKNSRKYSELLTRIDIRASLPNINLRTSITF